MTYLQAISGKITGSLLSFLIYNTLTILQGGNLSRWIQWWCRGCRSGTGAGPACVGSSRLHWEMFLFNNPQRTCCWCVLCSFVHPVLISGAFPQLFCGLGALVWSGGMEMLCLVSSSRQWLLFLSNICRRMLCAQSRHYLLLLSGVSRCSSVKKIRT